MKTSTLLIPALFLAACEPSIQPDEDPNRVARVVVSADGDMGTVVSDHNQFSWDLYAELTAEGDDNVFFSPFSATSALSMTLAGAEGNTETEMLDALRITLDEPTWHEQLGALTRDLSGDLDRGYTLHIANRLFGQAGYPFEQDFLDICSTDYAAPLEEWNFAADPDGGREHVNDWVFDQTEERIDDLLPAGSVSSDTRLVLANAIYFLADWATPFDRDLTYDGSFTRPDGSDVTVPMMVLDTESYEETGLQFGYLGNADVVRLPYADEEVSMVLIVPRETDGLAAVEASLDAATWQTAIDSLSNTDGTIVMPRVEMEFEADLVPVMRAMGMSDAFDPNLADLTGIADTDEGNLYIGGIFHKAFVSIDEEGTEAAAATAVVVDVETAAGSYVVADHPYLFAIQDDLTGALLFIGRVTDPS